MLMKSYTSYTEQQDYMLAGLIPNFLLTAENNQNSDVYDIEQFIEDVKAQYGYPCISLEGKVVDTVYKYPRDPDLYPLFSYTFSIPDLVVYQYEYSILAFIYKKDGEQHQFITRMD